MKFVLKLAASVAIVGHCTTSIVVTAFSPPPVSIVNRGVVSGVTTATSTFSPATSSVRLQSASNKSPVETTTSSVSPEVDYDALLKYHGAIVVQMSLLAAVFKGLDVLVGATGIADSIPTLALVPLFYALSLKSRVFNPLDNTRPNRQEAIEENKPNAGFGDRIMPSWTPPGVVFPIMWLLIIGPLRAYSAALVYQANGHEFLHPALLAFAFHLAVGDVWNSINNVEQRYGASVTGVLCVTTSALLAAVQYYGVSPEAGHLLGLPMIWFAIAASLITATWKLNPNPITGEIEPLYPMVVRNDGGEPMVRTKVAWLEK